MFLGAIDLAILALRVLGLGLGASLCQRRVFRFPDVLSAVHRREEARLIWSVQQDLRICPRGGGFDCIVSIFEGCRPRQIFFVYKL